MYSKIINPETGRAVNVNGRIGRQVLKKYINAMNGGEGRIWKMLDLNTGASQHLGLSKGLNWIGRAERLKKLADANNGEEKLLEQRIKWTSDGTGHTGGLEMLDKMWIERFADNDIYFNSVWETIWANTPTSVPLLQDLKAAKKQVVAKSIELQTGRRESDKVEKEKSIEVQKLIILSNAINKLIEIAELRNARNG